MPVRRAASLPPRSRPPGASSPSEHLEIKVMKILKILSWQSESLAKTTRHWPMRSIDLVLVFAIVVTMVTSDLALLWDR
jgi:hypothetical protein